MTSKLNADECAADELGFDGSHFWGKRKDSGGVLGVLGGYSCV